MSAAIWSFQQAVALRARIPTWAAVSPASCGSTRGPGPTRDSGVENTTDDGVKKPDTRVSLARAPLLLATLLSHTSLFPPRSLVCGGQPSPHKPLLVASHSACPPLSSSPHKPLLVASHSTCPPLSSGPAPPPAPVHTVGLPLLLCLKPAISHHLQNIAVTSTELPTESWSVVVTFRKSSH
jgi:hypothetical protein